MSNITTTNRRQFLKSGALLSGGLIISFMVPAGPKKILDPGLRDPEATFSPNAFLRIGKDGTINVILAHVEMGQGIWTTLTMLIAEELDADWKKIKVEHAPPGQPYVHTAFGIQITGGSSTTYSEFDRYRQAAIGTGRC
ncbi:MAG: molybdopterin cofactor-binding domain-containing protein [Ferruginibacter sp.]